jgi:hypothetical protein
MFSSTGFSFLRLSERSTRVDSEPRFTGERKAIRDKKERFFERKTGAEVAVAVVESAAGADSEWCGVGRKSYERESQALVGNTCSALSPCMGAGGRRRPILCSAATASQSKKRNRRGIEAAFRAPVALRAHLDEGIYRKGQKVTTEDVKKLNLEPHAIHPRWNYTIRPAQQASLTT